MQRELTDRADHIEFAIERIRGTLDRHGESAALDCAETQLLELAARPELFPPQVFPIPENGAGFYALSEPEDGHYGLYLNVVARGRSAPPHCHGTWAVMAGVRGIEESRCFRYEENPPRLIETHSQTIAPATACRMDAEEIHSACVVGDDPVMHLHLYGLSFSRFPRLAFYDLATGARSFRDPPVPLRASPSTV